MKPLDHTDKSERVVVFTIIVIAHLVTLTLIIVPILEFYGDPWGLIICYLITSLIPLIIRAIQWLRV